MSPIASAPPRLAVPARRPARGGVRAGRRRVGLRRPHRVLGGGRPGRREQALPLGHRQGARVPADRVAARGASLRRGEGGARLAVEHPPAGRLAGRGGATSSRARCSTAGGAPRRWREAAAHRRRGRRRAPDVARGVGAPALGGAATPTPSPSPIWPRSSTTSAVAQATATAGPTPRGPAVIIDCHGHYTTAPGAAQRLARASQLAAFRDGPPGAGYPADLRRRDPRVDRAEPAPAAPRARRRHDDLLAAGVRHGPPRGRRAGQHATGRGPATTSSRASSSCSRRRSSASASCRSHPAPPLDASVAELERCVTELGFVGCNLNPDPSGGHWTSPPLTDRYWYPIYEKMVELDVPAMVHVSSSCNPIFHATGAHYINADTTAFMQLIQGDLFADFPDLRLVIPHGGGAVPYHWGRYRGLADMLKQAAAERARDEERLLRHLRLPPARHRPAVPRSSTSTTSCSGPRWWAPSAASTRETGHYFDDTKRYIDAARPARGRRAKIYSGNARRVYPRLDKALRERQGAVDEPPRFTARRRLARVRTRTRSKPTLRRRRPGRSTPTATCSAPATVSLRAGAQVHAGRRGQGAAVRAARLPRLRAQRHRPGDLPRRRQQRPGGRAAGGRRTGPAAWRPSGPASSRAELADLHAAGVRGVRFNFVKRLVDPKPDDYYRGLAERDAPSSAGTSSSTSRPPTWPSAGSCSPACPRPSSSTTWAGPT